MTFKIVPKGTPGAMSIHEAMEVMYKKLKLYHHSQTTRKRLTYTAKRSWKRGYFSEASKKQSASLKKYWGSPKGKFTKR